MVYLQFDKKTWCIYNLIKNMVYLQFDKKHGVFTI